MFVSILRKGSETRNIETEFPTWPPAQKLSVWASTKESTEQAEDLTLIRSTGGGKKRQCPCISRHLGCRSKAFPGVLFANGAKLVNSGFNGRPYNQCRKEIEKDNSVELWLTYEHT